MRERENQSRLGLTEEDCDDDDERERERDHGTSRRVVISSRRTPPPLSDFSQDMAWHRNGERGGKGRGASHGVGPLHGSIKDQ